MQIMLSDDLIENNSKILRIIEFEIKLCEKSIASCFTKVKEFICDFTLHEGCKYLMQIFSDTVNSLDSQKW